MVRSKKSTLWVEHSKVNLIVGWALLRYSMNFFSSDGGPGQIQSMSSIYLFHRNGWIG